MQISSFNKILKPVSSFLVAVMIVNSFAFALLYSPKFVNAQQVVTDPTQTSNQAVYQSVKEAWNKSKEVLTKAYRATQTAFDLWQKNESILAKISYQLMYLTVTIMLQNMTQNIVNWLDNDGKGDLRLYDDFDEEFKRSLDLAGGAVVGRILGLNNGELCDPNFLKLNLAVAIDELQKPTFKESFKCSFSGGAKNLREFKDSFESGGWKSYVSFQRPENNDIGNYIKIRRELKKERIKNKEALEKDILVGDGLKPQTVCRVTKDIDGLSGINETLSSYDLGGIESKAPSTFSLGAKMKDIMGNYDFSSLEDFKIEFRRAGGDFVCKTETPASAIAELTSKVLTAPFDKLNKAAQGALERIGPGANSIFKPYFDAISTSAINLLIRKEKGLFSPKFKQRSKARSLRQSAGLLQETSNDLYAGNSLRATTEDLRDLLMKTVLDFSVFVGGLNSIVERKDVLNDLPLLVSGLTTNEYIRPRLLDRSWLRTPANPENTVSLKSDEVVLEAMKSVIDNKGANGFPLLPAAGTFNVAANLCGAFAQEEDVKTLNMTSPRVSENIGYIAPINTYTTRTVPRDCELVDTGGRPQVLSCGGTRTETVIDKYGGDLVLGGNPEDAWVDVGGRNVRIIAFNDSGRMYEIERDSSGNISSGTPSFLISVMERLMGESGIPNLVVPTPWPDRFVREIDTNGDFIPEPELTVTFIDDGTGYPIELGSPPTYPVPDSNMNERADDPALYASELVNIDENSPWVYYIDSDDNLSNRRGDIYYIKGNKYPEAALSYSSPFQSESVDLASLNLIRGNSYTITSADTTISTGGSMGYFGAVNDAINSILGGITNNANNTNNANDANNIASSTISLVDISGEFIPSDYFDSIDPRDRVVGASITVNENAAYCGVGYDDGAYVYLYNWNMNNDIDISTGEFTHGVSTYALGGREWMNFYFSDLSEGMNRSFLSRGDFRLDSNKSSGFTYSLADRPLKFFTQMIDVDGNNTGPGCDISLMVSKNVSSQWETVITDYLEGPSGHRHSNIRSYRLLSDISGIEIRGRGGDGGRCVVVGVGGTYHPRGSGGTDVRRYSVDMSAGEIIRYQIGYDDRSGRGREDCTISVKSTGSGGDINKIGVPANIIDTKYKIKYYSPSFTGASMFIENDRKIVMYDDFIDNNENRIADDYQYPILNPFDKDTKTLTIPSGTVISKTDNINPYKMRMGSFYEEIGQMINEFLVKIRVLVGYGREDRSDKKNNLSGMADQIGSYPDDDESYTSVTDVLVKYTNLIELYQTLFSGMSNEDALVGIDPNFDILNPTERAIVKALIGERCPIVPPQQGSSLYEGCPTFGEVDKYTMGGKFVFKEDNITGFATNPFTDTRSSVTAGILNLDEMTTQLAVLQPNKNIIKLIRLRQILEQLQVVENPEPIIPEDRVFVDTPEGQELLREYVPDKLSGPDRVLVSLRNYPEIERYLNEITRPDGSLSENKRIDDLIADYGFNSAKEAYPQISADLENVFPDIMVQVKAKLKDVFLKRTELELKKAKEKAIERLTDFVYFARDLSPAVQVQLPDDPVMTRHLRGNTTKMKMGDEESLIIRVVAGEFAESNVLINDDGSATNINIVDTDENCMALTGEKLRCGSDEYFLRGFRVVPWSGTRDPGNENYFKNILEVNIDVNNDNTDKIMEEALPKIAFRKTLMAGIIEKIKVFNEFMGVNVNSLEFSSNMLAKYDLPLNEDGAIDLEEWDKVIEEGLRDVYIYYSGFYNASLGVSSPGSEIVTSRIVDELGNFSDSTVPLNNDVKTTMNRLTKNFSLLQDLFSDIKNEFIGSNSSVMSLGNQIDDLKKLFKVMDAAYIDAAGCYKESELRAKPDTLMGLIFGNDFISLPIISGLFGGVDFVANFALGGYFKRKAEKKAKKKGRRIANRCSDAAGRYNKALIDVANMFICGRK